MSATPPGVAAAMLARMIWLTRAADLLGVPIIATLEEESANGPLLPALAGHLPKATPCLDKRHFGLAGQADILAAVRATGRSHAVLVGMETDVCVAQSALGLLDQGFAVAAVSDACFSPHGFHDAGLKRMAEAGAALITTKALHFEWAGDLATHYRLKNALGAPPEGVSF